MYLIESVFPLLLTTVNDLSPGSSCLSYWFAQTFYILKIIAFFICYAADVFSQLAFGFWFTLWLFFSGEEYRKILYFV